jgi:HlyD family secretion protein
VEVDAFPGRRLAGRVAKIGQSAIGTGNGASPVPAQARGSVDFEVVLTLLDGPEGLRPDLSATADIIVDQKRGVPAVPIIAVTVRDRPADEDAEGEAASGDHPADDNRTQEGVFLARDGKAVWQPVELGITGREHFEVVSGVSVGDSVVSGPYQRIRNLSDGDLIRLAGSPGSGRNR